MECGLERGQSVKFNTTLVVRPPNSVKKVKLLRDERRNDRQILRGGKYRIAKMHIAIQYYNTYYMNNYLCMM